VVIFAGVEGVVYRGRKAATACNVCLLESDNWRVTRFSKFL